jgi:hypothetical protein
VNLLSRGNGWRLGWQCRRRCRYGRLLLFQIARDVGLGDSSSGARALDLVQIDSVLGRNLACDW